MKWMLTAGGAEYHLSGPTCALNEFRIDDIAHALSQINRYNGHASRPYSVAEHSLLCADIAAMRGASASAQLACLLHDAHEAYVGDVSSPVKVALGDAWADFEGAHAVAYHRAASLTTSYVAHRALVKEIDLVALATERRDLMPFNAAEHAHWLVIDAAGSRVAPADIDLCARWRVIKGWAEWRTLFLEAYTRLRAAALAEAQLITSGEQPLGMPRAPQPAHSEDGAAALVQRDLMASTAQAAMASGYEGSDEPSDEWLRPFWNAGRALATAEDRLVCLDLAGMDRLPALAEPGPQTDEPTLTLRDIGKRLGFYVPAAFLSGMGIEPSARKFSSGLYRESDLQRVVAALGPRLVAIRHAPAAAAQECAA